METWVAERYLSSRVELPGQVLQGILNSYIAGYHWVERLMHHRWGDIADEASVITEHSEALMCVHYDMPRGLFENMLGPSMKYSMGLWERGARTLEEAQTAMLDDVIAKVGICDGDRVLDIGCGFGSFATRVLDRMPHAEVVGLTLSAVQAEYIRERMEFPGHPLHEGRFTLVLDDFNRVSFHHPFDKVVSLGVFEHVTNLGLGLEKIRGFLAPQGRCLLHYIVFTPAIGHHGMAARQDPFINRYIFPGGRIWAQEELFRHQESCRVDTFWYLSGVNYRDTLRAWLENFLRNRAIIREQTGLSQRVMRIWEIYLRACIAVFGLKGGAAYGNGQYLLRAA